MTASRSLSLRKLKHTVNNVLSLRDKGKPCKGGTLLTVCFSLRRECKRSDWGMVCVCTWIASGCAFAMMTAFLYLIAERFHYCRTNRIPTCPNRRAVAQLPGALRLVVDGIIRCYNNVIAPR